MSLKMLISIAVICTFQSHKTDPNQDMQADLQPLQGCGLQLKGETFSSCFAGRALKQLAKIPTGSHHPGDGTTVIFSPVWPNQQRQSFYIPVPTPSLEPISPVPFRNWKSFRTLSSFCFMEHHSQLATWKSVISMLSTL